MKAAFLERLSTYCDPWLSEHAAGARLRRIDVLLARHLGTCGVKTQQICIGHLAPALTPAFATVAARLAPASSAAGAALLASADPGSGSNAWLAFRFSQTYPQRPNPWHADTDPRTAGEAYRPAHPWPPARLPMVTATTCRDVEWALFSESQAPHVTEWAEWLLKRLELKGLAAGWDQRAGVWRFDLADALLAVAAAWRTWNDLRYLNCLLRVGDILLRAPRPRDGLPQMAALVCLGIQREAAMARLTEERRL